MYNMKTLTNEGTNRQGEVTQINKTGADRRTEMLAMAKARHYKKSKKKEKKRKEKNSFNTFNTKKLSISFTSF